MVASHPAPASFPSCREPRLLMARSWVSPSAEVSSDSLSAKGICPTKGYFPSLGRPVTSDWWMQGHRGPAPCLSSGPLWRAILLQNSQINFSLCPIPPSSFLLRPLLTKLPSHTFPSWSLCPWNPVKTLTPAEICFGHSFYSCHNQQMLTEFQDSVRFRPWSIACS